MRREERHAWQRKSHMQRQIGRTSLVAVVKNLLCKARDAGSISGWGTQIPQAAQIGQEEKKRKREREAKRDSCPR